MSYLLLPALLLCTAGTSQAAEASEWKSARFGNTTIELNPKCQPLPSHVMGPFVTLGDKSVLAIDKANVLVSKDEGKTWSSRPLFAHPEQYQCYEDWALLSTRDGTLVLAFLNQKELAFKWNQAHGGPLPGCRLPVYITRSTDNGKTWDEPKLLQDGYCGALRSIIQLRSGRIVLGCQKAVADPGRHVSLTYASDDEGKTWKASNVIDLGKEGGYGDHGGAIEPTLAQLHDDRVWMLIRTPNGVFTEAFSTDGLTWKDIRPSKIPASDSPGQLLRLQSRRLVLFWNRYVDPEKKAGRREQLSMAFSEDDGQNWTKPVVVARNPTSSGQPQPGPALSYPSLYERVPGELWVTTMLSPLRIRILEDDFFPRRLSNQTYQAQYLPAAHIKIDGLLDEPEWDRANLETHFIFPWKKAPAPSTEFRALCDDESLYFSFRVMDADIVVLDTFRDEMDSVFEDRSELYFGRDDHLKDYYCIEIDSRGRYLDYKGSSYRKLDMAWKWPGVETKGTPIEGGYIVEGRLSLAGLETMGFPRLRPGVKIRCGIFRAEFSHDRSGRPVVQRESIHNAGRKIDGPPPIEEWMSWIDPNAEEPDFHVPTSLGWLEIVK